MILPDLMSDLYRRH